jgi:outer membrane protein insertion porin family
MRRWILAILVVLASPLRLPCQENPQQPPTVSYEGQNVADVDLVANPKISVEKLVPLVQQKAGEPYSDHKVRSTTAALEETGMFRKVDVRVKPTAAGLDLTFMLEPALYFGMFQFPGADRFSYSRLQQVVDIPSESPYKDETVTSASDALRQFFVSQGFFTTQVRPEPKFDEEHLLANVDFHIEPGKRAKIGVTRVMGPPEQEAARLLHDTRSVRAWISGASLKPGKEYTPRRVNGAVRQIQKDLASRHYLASRVQLDKPVFHPDTNRADISISVNLGPRVDVRTVGARLSWLPFLGTRRKKNLIPVFSEGAIDTDLIEEGRRNLVDFFQKKGYFDVDVQANVHRQPGRAELVYGISKGRKQKVERVAFRGNRHFDEDALQKIVPVKPRHFPLFRGHFSDQLLQQGVRSLTAFYHDHGFENVKVDANVVHQVPKIYVDYLITEGPQTLVEKLTLSGNQHVSAVELAPHGGFNLRPDEPFSPKALAQDRSNILATYLDRGYLNAAFQAEVSRQPDDPTRVEVRYNITERQRVRVDQVLFLGQNHTRVSLIQKTADLRPETPWSQSDILAAESKLYELGIFDWVSVDPRRPPTDQTQEDVLVKVHEGRQNTLTYGFGLQIARQGGNLPSGTIAIPGLPVVGTGNTNFASSEKTIISPRGSVEYTRSNFRGLGQSISVSALVSRLDQRAVASFTDPRFRLSGWKSLWSASLERNTENPVFDARLAEGSWQLEKPLNKSGSRIIQLRYRFRRTVLSDILIPDLVLPEGRRLRLSTLSGTWIRDTRDKPLDASTGFYQTVDLAITPRFLGSNANFARVLGQSSYYKSFGKTVWANRVEVGLAKAISGNVPTSERFFSGGGTTLRGFPINGAGPQRTVSACGNPNDPSTCTNIRVPVGGNQLFILNSEFRFPTGIKKNLGLAVFYDGGNVYGPVGLGDFFQNYTNTVGVGVRYATPIGPIRFDVGHNLNPVTGLGSTQFFVTLGQSF